MSNTIPIFFTFDKNYVLPALVAFESLLENASSQYHYTLYVVTIGSELPPPSQARLQRIVQRHPNAKLNFREVEVDFDEEWKRVNQGHYSREVFLKLLPARIFPEHDWIVCSDVDVVFSGDISQIRSFPPAGDYVSGVKSIKKIDQFRDRTYDDTLRETLKGSIGGGLLAYNLRKIRRDEMESRLLNDLQEHAEHLVQPEQDILNLTFEDQVHVLPLRFMFCTYLYSAVRDGPLDLSVSGNWWYYLTKKYLKEIESGDNWSANEIRKAFESPVQIHYAGGSKPWNTLFCYRKIIWIRYLISTGYLIKHISENELSNIAQLGQIIVNTGRRYLGKIKNKIFRTIGNNKI